MPTCLILTLSFHYAWNDINCRRSLKTLRSDTGLQQVGKQRAVTLQVVNVLNDCIILTYTMPNESYQTYLCSFHVCELISTAVSVPSVLPGARAGSGGVRLSASLTVCGRVVAGMNPRIETHNLAT